jgi:CDP-diacylglycerol--serine O-phosphatidyltransferase
MTITKHIPNAITMLNLFSGCVAAYFAFQGNYDVTFYLVLLAGLFDFLDGLAARVLKAYSSMGKELDSLADMISFGLVPGIVVFSMLGNSINNDYLKYIAFLLPVFSALRLAKFNIDDTQTKSFIGLPTPSNAFFWVGLAFSYNSFFESNPYLLIGLTLVFSYLLVSGIPMFALKVSSLKWKDNRVQYVFLAGVIVLIGFLGWNALSPVIGWYILSSVLFLRLIK